MAKKKQQGPGRPTGTAVYTGGILRFAVSAEMIDRLRQLQDRDGLPTISEAARKALAKGLSR